jgi:hypothetical protein
MGTVVRKPPLILDRYNRQTDGAIIIDVAVRSINDLYNFFDRKTSYSKRDLDEDFVDYLIDCQKEIRQQSFVIRITIENPVDQIGETRIQTSINNYFHYLRDIEIQNLKRLMSKSGAMLVIGLGLIIVNVMLPLSEFFPKGMIGSVLSEGLIIAAWVSLWEVFANIFMKWLPYQQRLRIFTRISKAAVHFVSGIGKKNVNTVALEK